MPSIKSEKYEVHCVRGGRKEGSPLVFLHPVGLDLTWWGEQFAKFGDYDLIAVDMPGHGLSGTLAEPPSFDLLADALASVLTHLDTGPVHLVGISVGGMIAQTFALRRPDLVRSLSLVATLCSFPDPVRAALRERARVARAQGMGTITQLSNERWFPASFRASRPDMMDRTTHNLLRQDPEFHAQIWEMISALDLEARIPAITCPTLVITGAEDGNAPTAAGRKIADLIPGATLVDMPGIGHFPPFEAPAQFNAVLRAFLARVDGVPTPA